MKKGMRIAIPIVVLLLFVLVMTGDWYFKRPRSQDEDVALMITGIREAVLADDWECANRQLVSLQQAWQKIIRRVQLSVERDQINALTISLSRLSGALLARDRTGALMELAEAEEHWRDLGK